MRNPYENPYLQINIREGQIQRVMSSRHEAAKLVDEVIRLRKLTRNITEPNKARKVGGSDVQSE